MQRSETPQRDITGMVLIIVGVLLLLRNLGVGLGMGEIWPWFIVLFGLAFGAMFLADRSQYFLLMPTTILVMAGVVFGICSAFQWSLMGELWPLLVIAPGIGFLSMSYFGPKGTSFMLPGIGLLSGGVIILVRQSAWWRFWPLLLVAAGLGIVIRELRRRT